MAVILGLSVLFAHARLSLRFARAVSGSISLAAISCLLSLASWILFTAGAIGIAALALHLTGIMPMERVLGVLIGLFALSAIPYHALLAILKARVMRRSGSNHHAGLTVFLILVLSVPALFLNLIVLTLLLGTEPFDPWTIVANPTVVIIVAGFVLFAHAQFSLRFASSPAGPIFFAVKWSLLSLGSWILFTAASFGVFVFGFRIAGIAQIGGVGGGLFGLFGLSAIPYLLVLAVLGGCISERIGGSYQAGLTFVLTILLSIPALVIYFALSMLILGRHDLD